MLRRRQGEAGDRHLMTGQDGSGSRAIAAAYVAKPFAALNSKLLLDQRDQFGSGLLRRFIASTPIAMMDMIAPDAAIGEIKLIIMEGDAARVHGLVGDDHCGQGVTEIRAISGHPASNSLPPPSFAGSAAVAAGIGASDVRDEGSGASKLVYAISAARATHAAMIAHSHRLALRCRCRSGSCGIASPIKLTPGLRGQKVLAS